MTCARYAIALGSNRPLAARLPPRALVMAAIEALGHPPLRLITASPIMMSNPLGPSLRLYANAAAIVETELSPPVMLAHLKSFERAFGRRAGRRWGARTLDLDIILWSGGQWKSRTLQVPHRAFRERLFVLAPLGRIAPAWRDPASGLAIRHLLAHATRSKPVDRTGKRL